MHLTSEQVAALCSARTQDAAKYVSHLNSAMAYYRINTRSRAAMFFAQISHESGRLRIVEENLNYTAARLMTVWPKRFPNLAIAGRYAHNPQALAEKTYGGRYGNGPEGSGDGWRYRGRGLKQLTFLDNYRDCEKGLALIRPLPIASNPDLLLLPEAAAWSAAWFWSANDLNEAADAKDMVKSTRIIQGGREGLENRIGLYKYAYQLASTMAFNMIA